MGYGLEGAIPDMVAKNILDDMVPYFKDGNYEAGIRVAFGEILSKVEEEYQIAIEGKDAVTEGVASESEAAELADVIRLAIIIILIVLIFGRRNNRRGGGGRGGYRGPIFIPFRGGFGSGFGGGGGGFGGGNFGGGGSSGGGGASGGW